MKEILTVDIETYSDIDIAKCGAYRYAQSPVFEIILFSFKRNGEPTQCIDLASGERISSDVREMLQDPGVIKRAYNAEFEWYCLNAAGYRTPLEQWECSMVHALYESYPAGLKATGDALGLPADKKKLVTGNALIRYFCKPCRPTKSNGGRTRNLPHHDPAKWDLFKAYNIQDVEAEYAIDQRLAWTDLPAHEWERWRRDTRMNAYGVRLDRQLIHGALALNERSTEELVDAARTITGLDNPNSNKQLLDWINAQGVETDNLRKATVEELLEGDLPGNVREMLLIRQKLGKSSVAKYEAMKRCIGLWDRARGLLQYYGANRSGRYAGRLIQVQNLPRVSLDDLDAPRQMVIRQDYDGVKEKYGNIPDTLSQLIRTAFIPSEGHKFIVSDFSAIEARIIAWLAGEQHTIDAFVEGKDIYCATASQMFGVPVEKHGINGELRQKGKIAVLACGYQGGVGAMKAMGAIKMGIPEGELQGIVEMWRQSNPHIVRLWWEIEHTAKGVIQTGNVGLCHGIEMRLEGGADSRDTFLTIRLPSSRKLFYCRPEVDTIDNPKGSILFTGQNQTTKKWERQETYGGKLVENIVQGIARDCLTETITRVEDAGYRPVMHVHDEIIIDATPDQKLEDVNEIFARPIDWAPGLPLKGDGFESEYYKKD